MTARFRDSAKTAWLLEMVAAWAVLLAAVLVITAGAVALGVMSHIERPAPAQPTSPDRTGYLKEWRAEP